MRVNGRHYPDAGAPMAELGILLDARAVHPGPSAVVLTGLAAWRLRHRDA